MKSVGVTPHLVPTRVEEHPLLIVSDVAEPSGYASVEERVRPLLKRYDETSDEAARNGILKQIAHVVRKNGEGKARYSTQLGNPTASFLVPHDSRGRDLIALSPDGKKELFFWWFEGRTVSLVDGGSVTVNEPIGIPPGGMVVNEDGSLLHSVLFERTEDFPMHNAERGAKVIPANHYYVLDAPFLRTLIYTPGGALLAEESAYVLNLVAAGFAGIQTKGEQRVIYDPYSPFQSPAYRVHENGRLAGVTVDEKYTAEKTLQKFERTELAPRTTAPGVLDVIKTVFEEDEIQSKDVQGIWQAHWQDLKNGWVVIAAYLGSILGTIGLGSLSGAFRQSRRG